MASTVGTTLYLLIVASFNKPHNYMVSLYYKIIIFVCLILCCGFHECRLYSLHHLMFKIASTRLAWCMYNAPYTFSLYVCTQCIRMYTMYTMHTYVHNVHNAYVCTQCICMYTMHMYVHNAYVCTQCMVQDARIMPMHKQVLDAPVRQH